jgi:hypothetical protein
MQTIISYPKNFFTTPYLPYEINFIDNSVWNDVKANCKNKTIIFSGRPTIAKFF